MLCASTMNRDAKEPKEETTTFKLKSSAGSLDFKGRLLHVTAGCVGAGREHLALTPWTMSLSVSLTTSQDLPVHTHLLQQSLVTEATVSKGMTCPGPCLEINGQDGRAELWNAI